MSYKIIRIFSLPATLVLSLAMPANIFVQADVPPTPPTGMCARISALDDTVATRTSDRSDVLSAKTSEREDTLQTKREERDAKLAAHRDTQDAHLDEVFAKIEAKAQNESQQEAVNAFKIILLEAIDTRRAAVDQAIETFRSGVDDAVEARKTARDAAVDAYKIAISDAFNKAEADCVAGVNAATVRTTLRSSLEAARAKFKSDRQAIDKISDTIKPLVETKQAAFKKAHDDFKASLEAAKATLKTALESSADTNSQEGQ
ncbi:MAG: hypothetical protein A3A80_01735 [Candidatus Terrybacteria bacterium RIFCSPLOWO2_01_FULL_44_24]|uniref:DUF5667 domain-containing protein n=1 Tax=Candidatus Terrybacteria bacterium RIFCSPHIGHO2_01_FULL_43_35 TaxID=1802361 RepID=A0A1G2PFN6_9BACT|nr:MAG: hypothetical protein A2828_01525 [Candidatus Terrybacteria bacterium RIFCSPHIGHO2_01_FULL_43_35]OHA50806.1 MAG: hypothetical protein A3A80_01735 [Candidatus Terrybacteria bacterium RIFCSPLOWO2_01_FULL_44_24]